MSNCCGEKENERLYLHITVNGDKRCDEIPAHISLLTYLRDYLGLMGAKRACNAGECGACTVLLNGQPVYSCITLAAQAEGKAVETVEGLSDIGGLGGMAGLHPIQQAYIEAGAVQCGFCTPGFIMSTKALLEANHNPTEQQIKEALAGNLCRCTGYVQVIEAVKLAAQKMYGKGV